MLEKKVVKMLKKINLKIVSFLRIDRAVGHSFQKIYNIPWSTNRLRSSDRPFGCMIILKVDKQKSSTGRWNFFIYFFVVKKVDEKNSSTKSR